ncbi:MAG: hypothetical protein Q9M33_10735 [Robiginitomaculum sp.]|nr:hypothetical protein [Robiginitomaculum sp.]MDQ7076366.1 hypothetical protein [Robiginitomaculum sp.]
MMKQIIILIAMLMAAAHASAQGMQQGALAAKLKDNRISCQPVGVLVTTLAYQIKCRYYKNKQEKTAIFVMRRDRSRPGWALGSSDFALLQRVLADKGFAHHLIIGKSVHLPKVGAWIFTTQVGASPVPERYCTLRGNNNKIRCYDLKAFHFNPAGDTS